MVCLLVLSVLGILPASLSHAQPEHVPGDGFTLEVNVIQQDFAETLKRVEDAAALNARHFIVPVVVCQDGRTASTVH